MEETGRDAPRGVLRNLALRESDAAEWLSRRGSTAVADKALRLVGDEVSTSRLRFARIWQSPGVVRVEAGSLCRIVYQAEGTSLVRRDRGAREGIVGPEGMFFVCADDSYEIEFDKATARYEIDFESALTDERMKAVSLLASSEKSSVFRSILISSINFVLNSTVHVDDDGFGSFRDSMSSLAMSTLAQSFDEEGEGGRRDGSALHRRALHLIRERYDDPEFTIDSLAEELGISRRHLYRVFSDAGSPAPSPVLRAYRAHRARQLLESDEGPRKTRAQVSRLAGFRTVAMMRAALQTDAEIAI